MRELRQRWEVGLMALIRDRYRCSSTEAVRIRGRFLEWQMDAMGIPLELGADGQPVLPGEVLAVVDGCAFPEQAEQAAQRAAEELQASNLSARTLVCAPESEGLTCPHCHEHTTDIRFIERSPDATSYFICRVCGRSFVPADCERAD